MAPESSPTPTVPRRHLLVAAGGVLGGVAIGFPGRGESALFPTRLRPPGVPDGDETNFMSACIRCGQCVQACPPKYDCLNLAGLHDRLGAGTPYIVAREAPCGLCFGFDAPLCIEACPTNALRPLERLEDIRMGVAVIDESTCWSWNGVSCRHCYHACPWPDDALTLDPRIRPTITPEHCIGCGLCEHACPMEESAIIITPQGSANLQSAERPASPAESAREDQT